MSEHVPPFYVVTTYKSVEHSNHYECKWALLLHAVQVGATCIFFPKFVKDDPAKIFRILKKFQTTAILGSPAFVYKVAQYAADNNTMMPVLCSGVGGAPIFKKTFRTIMSTTKDKKAALIYGSTEAEPISLIFAEEKLAVEKDDSIGICVGKPVFENSVKVIKLLSGKCAYVPFSLVLSDS